MPTYSYKCEKCETVTDKFFKIEERAKSIRCRCGGYAERFFTPVNFNKPFSPYPCPITGKMIESVQAHKDNLARHGCHELEPGEDKDAQRRLKAADDKLDSIVDNAVEELVHKMPEEKRNQLFAEVTNDPSIGGDEIFLRK